MKIFKNLKDSCFRPAKYLYLLSEINTLKKSSIKRVRGLSKKKEIRTLRKKYRLAFQPKTLSELKENTDLEAEFNFEVLPEFKLLDFNS